MTREPLVTVASITSAAAALVALVAAFGADLTTDQQAAILAVVAVLAPLIVAVFARGRVTPVDAPRSEFGVPLVPRRGPLD